jgi:hypothetical protein
VGTAVVAALVIACGSARAQECVGDCDGNGMVTINELILGVSIALGNQPITACGAFDCQHNETVPINCLIQGVNGALDGCSAAVATSTATPMPATPTATPGNESVCGGPVTSVPKLCDLSVQPNPVAPGGSVTIKFSGSDLEGDVNALCTSLVPKGQPPNLKCNAVQPTNAKINKSFTIGPLQLPNDIPVGDYTFVLEVRDAAGHRSNSVSTDVAVAG